MSERDYGGAVLLGPFEGGETRIYVLRMAARVDERMHFQVIIIAVTKGGEGNRDSSPTPSVAGAEVIYRYCLGDRYRTENYRRLRIIERNPPVFLYFDFNYRELARARRHRLVISALSHSFGAHYRFFFFFFHFCDV